MTRFSRRAFLCAGATGATATLPGCVSGGGLSLESWTPAAGAWPLARYDTSNTGHNPTATPPRSGVDPVWTVETPVAAHGLLVVDGLVTAYGDRGIVVFQASDRQRVLEEFVPAYVAGIAPAPDSDRRLYAAGPLGVRDGSAVQLLRGWEYTAEDPKQILWRKYETGDGRGPAGLVANTETVVVGHYAGHDRQLVTFDAASGTSLWHDEGIYPTLADGSLYVAANAGVSRYEPRTGLGASLNDGLTETWTAQYSGETVPTVSAGRVIVGEDWSPPGGWPTLFGYDASTGEQLWEPKKFGGTANAPAVVNDTAFLSTSISEDFGEYYLPNSGELRAVALQDGTVQWVRETAWVPNAVVIGNNGVVVMGGGYPDGKAYPNVPNGTGGRVRAYDAASGDVLWTFSTPQWIASLALVGSTVYAGATDGTVFALRSA